MSSIRFSEADLQVAVERMLRTRPRATGSRQPQEPGPAPRTELNDQPMQHMHADADHTLSHRSIPPTDLLGVPKTMDRQTTIEREEDLGVAQSPIGANEGRYMAVVDMEVDEGDGLSVLSPQTRAESLVEGRETDVYMEPGVWPQHEEERGTPGREQKSPRPDLDRHSPEANQREELSHLSSSGANRSPMVRATLQSNTEVDGSSIGAQIQESRDRILNAVKKQCELVVRDVIKLIETVLEESIQHCGTVV